VAEKFKPAESIAEVISRLEKIIDASIEKNTRLGYFAALYRQVTVAVKEGIARGDFEDGPRMERLDVVFANRYLRAHHEFETGAQATLCWLFSFKATKKWRPLILQHLLLGMNAHINLDLGIAAAQTSPGEKLAGLKNDFMRINKVLSRLLGSVQSEINSVSPLLKLADKFGGRTDEAVLNFSIEVARDEAWNFALALNDENEADKISLIKKRDKEITDLARLILSPGKFLNCVLFVVRIFETSNVERVIKTLF